MRPRASNKQTSLFAYWLWSCVVTVLILLTKYRPSLMVAMLNYFLKLGGFPWACSTFFQHGLGISLAAKNRAPPTPNKPHTTPHPCGNILCHDVYRPLLALTGVKGDSSRERVCESARFVCNMQFAHDCRRWSLCKHPIKDVRVPRASRWKTMTVLIKNLFTVHILIWKTQISRIKHLWWQDEALLDTARRLAMELDCSVPWRRAALNTHSHSMPRSAVWTGTHPQTTNNPYTNKPHLCVDWFRKGHVCSYPSHIFVSQLLTWTPKKCHIV